MVTRPIKAANKYAPKDSVVVPRQTYPNQKTTETFAEERKRKTWEKDQTQPLSPRKEEKIKEREENEKNEKKDAEGGRGGGGVNMMQEFLFSSVRIPKPHVRSDGRRSTQTIMSCICTKAFHILSHDQL